MPTPKIILYKHKTYSDGLHPICIQVIKNGKAVRKVIGRCSQKDWLTSKSRVSPRNIEAPRINNDIEIALKNYGLSKGYDLKSLFDEQIEIYRTNQQVARYNINQLVRDQLFAFSPDLDFDGVTETLIYRFAAHLGNKPGTVKEKMNVLGAILKKAKKRNLISINPFEDISFPKGRSIKTKLTIQEINLLIDAELTGKVAEARDIFVASIYLRGIRIGDLLNLSVKNIIDSRLHYTEIKTGRTHNVGVPPELLEIFDRWKGKNKFGYIFSFLEAEHGKDEFKFKSAMRNAIAKLNRFLKIAAKKAGIEKSISPHTARHSFSKIANDTIKNTTITKDLVGHATLAVHEGYISDLADDVIMDAYAKQVLDRLKKD